MTDRRRKLTAREKDAIRARQNYVCPGLPHLRIKCGRDLMTGRHVFDHIDQRVFTKSDDLDEFQALCADGRFSCNSIKTHGYPQTSAGSDANKRAKIRRSHKATTMRNYKAAVRILGQGDADLMFPAVARLKRRRKIRSRGFVKGNMLIRFDAYKR